MMFFITLFFFRINNNFHKFITEYVIRFSSINNIPENLNIISIDNTFMFYGVSFLYDR
jgi:hypothetical protein